MVWRIVGWWWSLEIEDRAAPHNLHLGGDGGVGVKSEEQLWLWLQHSIYNLDAFNGEFIFVVVY